MASAPQSASTSPGPTERTPAQWFALLGGGVLVLVGIVGFFADASFQVGRPHDSGDLLGLFEVNAIHNIVHIATGALLLAGAPRPDTAKLFTLIFAGAYAAVTVIGLIQGDTVLGLIPVNAADNVLHIVLTLTAVLAAFASPGGRPAAAAR